MSQSPASPNTPHPKTASAPAGLHELVRNRWSPRSFADREVSPEDLRRLLEAARWAASSYNEQPWRFLLARKSDAAAFARILGLLSERNQKWARNAPVLMLTFGKRTFSHNGTPNRYALHDAGMALATLMLQATALGLYVHGMGGFDQARARAEFAIPEDYEVGAAVAIGHLGDPAGLAPEFQDGERAARSRKPLSEIVFEGAWGSPADL